MAVLLRLLLLSTLLSLAGCTVMFDAVSSEERSVPSRRDPGKTLTILSVGEFKNFALTRTVRLPAGIYALEGEDADYLYFAAPEPVEYRIVAGGAVQDGQRSPGGVALAKRYSMVPASVYSSIGGGRKILTWKLGSEFMAEEGRRWKRSF